MKSRFGTDAKGSPAFPEGQVSRSDAQTLRALAKEISRVAAPRLEETALVLYDRDPGYLQAQWYVTSEALTAARRLFPGDGTGLRQVLRLCRLDREDRIEIVASLPQGSGASEGAGEDGFALPGDGAEYSCELGLESDAGGWLLLARSNRVRSADRQLPPSRTTAVPDNPHAWNAPLATAEQPKEIEAMPVEAALAAVGEPLHPVFPNLELDDAPPPGHPAPPEETPGQARLQDREPESPSGILEHPALDLETDDSPPGHSAPPKEEGVAKGTDLRPLTPSPQSLSRRERGFCDTLKEVPGRIQPESRKPEYPPGVPPYLVSYGESDNAPRGHFAPLTEAPRPEMPEQEIPDQAGLRDWRPEFSPGIPHDPAPHPETRAEFPSDVPVEAALAAVGEPLYPVFPNLEPDDVPPPGYSESLGETPGQTWLQDRGPEFPPGVPQDSVPYLEPTTDLPPGAHLVDMPPPLLPSSPGLDTATADMPGPIYDPRAALSSAVLSGGALPPLPDLEIHAELIVQGRAAAGSRVDLFGYPIAVGADGRFYIRRPIDISALEPLAVGGGLLAWLEAAGHG
ncbi:hypothetical protein [Candidatus Thiosymbion oneisti]|uniref:hypothetical protein n=1 Tax=Candidatus Thiosymbion oneisti TaxID=589554 RepID=UPI00106173A3|nr:hypothetical protein [Candidatus Thiosymbion oneisti]